jgi:hypothetical protein
MLPSILSHGCHGRVLGDLRNRERAGLPFFASQQVLFLLVNMPNRSTLAGSSCKPNIRSATALGQMA